jgi:hypothetical protein
VAAGLPLDLAACASSVDEFLRLLGKAGSSDELADIMAEVCRELGFRYYALIHHTDLRGCPAGRVRMIDYPPAIVERIIEQATWRRDPVIRASLFAGRAFLWSELPCFLQLDRRDRQCLAQGVDEGLNEGITVCARTRHRSVRTPADPCANQWWLPDRTGSAESGRGLLAGGRQILPLEISTVSANWGSGPSARNRRFQSRSSSQRNG